MNKYKRSLDFFKEPCRSFIHRKQVWKLFKAHEVCQLQQLFDFLPHGEQFEVPESQETARHSADHSPRLQQQRVRGEFGGLPNEPLINLFFALFNTIIIVAAIIIILITMIILLAFIVIISYIIMLIV